MRKRKPAQHDRVDDRELRHRAADAEREHEDGEKTKNFVLQQDAESDTDVLSERFENHDDFPSVAVDDPAVAQLDDAIAIGGVFLRMRDLHDGRPFGVQLLEQLHDFFGLAGVQVAGRLVGQDQFWLGDDRARDADQLLLAAGKLARIEILFADDREAIERVGDERGALRFAVAPIGERDVEVLVNRQVVEQIVVLENETDLLVTQRGALFWFRRWTAVSSR